MSASKELPRSRVYAAAAVTLVAAAVLASCGSGQGSSGTAGPNDATERPTSDANVASLTVGVAAAPRSLDPAHSFDSMSMLVTAELFDTLVDVTAGNEVQPRLAESWESPDPLTHVFSLRDDAAFWDGSPVTADDVAFSLSRHLDPDVASEFATVFQSVETVDATDEREVTVTLRQADPEILAKLAMAGFVIQKKHAEASGDALGGPEELIVGSGPYEVTDYSSATGATLERHDGYWDEAPAVEQLTYTVIGDQETLRLAMESGEVDLTFLYPIDSSLQWDGLSGVELTYFDSPAVTTLALDMSAPPLDDVHVRRAIAHAVDRDAIIESLLDGRARPAHSMADPMLWEGLAAETGADVEGIYADLPRYEYDLDAARAELAQSAHPDGVEIEVNYPATTPALGRVAQVLKQSLAEVGVTLNLNEMQQQEYLGAIYGGEPAGMVPVQLGAISPDPNTLLGFLVDQTPFNIAKYAPQGVDDALAANRTGSPDERVDALTTLITTMAEDAPYVPLYYAQGALATSSEVVFAGEGSYWELIFSEWASKIKAAG